MNDYILSPPDYSPAALAEADIEDIRFDERQEAISQLVLDREYGVCARCGGSGAVYECIGVHCITHDMAMDACDMSLEGASQEEFGWMPCPTCHGTGYTEGSE